jgi:tetratricopeptide (TPR) repeat protein
MFCSYAHKDERLRDQLDTHLAMLKRDGLVTAWHDRKIVPGHEWNPAIDQHLNSAALILLLISPDFIASDFCYGSEMQQAMKRHEAGEARVVPIFLRPCDWKTAPFGKLQGLPTNAKPVTKWENRDEAFAIVAKGIRAAIEELAGRPTDFFAGLTYFEQGASYLEDRRYDLAIEAFNRAVELEPATHWIYYNRGLAYYFKNNFAAAIADWDRCVELDPDNAMAFRQRANAYASKSDYARAMADYNRAIELDPKAAKAYYNRGRLHDSLEDRKSAIADFKKVLELKNDPDVERDARGRLDENAE